MTRALVRSLIHAALPLVILVSLNPATAPARETPEARPTPPTPGIYRLGELHRVEAARLDRSHCFLLQALSPLDLHGPHLPAATSFELSDAFTDAVAERLRKSKPEWSVVILPPLPIGAGSTGELGGVYLHSSTVPVDLFMLRRFLGNWFLAPAENAHPNLSIISFHLDPQHLKAISDACDYYVQNYGMGAINVMSYLMADSTTLAGARAIGTKALGDVPEADLVFEMLSGGVAETSMMLHVHPDEVDRDFTELEPRIATSWGDAVTIIKTFGWPGYLGHPARATPAYGKSLWEYLADRAAALVLERAEGSLMTARPRFEDAIRTDFALRE
ncbi:MAG TPA: creatininase family protein, partial [Candidatus Eisenbacteria bacterium]